MSASIRISRKTARVCLDILVPSRWTNAAIQELEAALKPKRSVAPARKRKAAKAKTRKEETSEIRAAVFARAHDTCEACECVDATDLHHALGRKNARQHANNCLALCRGCHESFTDKKEGRTVALSEQMMIFARMNLHGTANALSRELAYAKAKARLSRQAEERAAQ